MDFKVGDVVKLKSGGPLMTVSKYPCFIAPDNQENYDMIECKWFNDEGSLKIYTFAPDMIERIQD